MGKRIFDIPVTWMMAGTEHVEADTLPEALRTILEGPARSLPANARYISDSFQVGDTTDIMEANGIEIPLTITETDALVRELDIRFAKIKGMPDHMLAAVSSDALIEHLRIFRGENYKP